MDNQAYSRALKFGEKGYRNAVTRGEYPYLPALDDILACVNVYMEEKLGVVDIPLEQIVGTKTAGRQNAFAVNFMPLMEPGTEFAAKWSRLYDFQTETGNTDPIVAYEFMNKFYVQEGNKRVSVFKFLDAASIEGEVIRIIPKKSDSLENKLYYEFLDFYKCNQINYLWFSKLGSFETLTAAVGKEPGEIWSEDEINEFEKELSDWGAIIIKFWVQIDKDTQLERFTDRQNNPEKRWKITDEDWRNREKWDLYEEAVDEMLQKTSTTYAPWHILESVDKKYARIKALKIIIKELEKSLN